MELRFLLIHLKVIVYRHINKNYGTSTMATENEQKPDYIGHRVRLKERFLSDNGASMPDYELLELLLTFAIPRRDVKPLAKKLLKTFGNLGNVLHASTLDLRNKGELSDNVIALLHLFVTCSIRTSSKHFADGGRPIITVWSDFIDYCCQQFGYKEVEETWAFFFSARMEYIDGIKLTTGTMDRTTIPIAHLIHEAINHKALNVVLAHNHPSGLCKPSDEDIMMTRLAEENLAIAGVYIYDHIIITPFEHFSFRANGYIENAKKKRYNQKL